MGKPARDGTVKLRIDGWSGTSSEPFVAWKGKKAFKHGHYTAEAIASRREIAKLLRDARALVKQVS